MSAPVIGQIFNDGRSWDGSKWVARWEPASAGGNYISVVDYGAVGDNIADDGPAIQAAIDANPGRTIFLPKPSSGNYRITAPLTIRSAGTYLLGENRTQTRILNAGAGDALVIGPADPGAGVLQGGNGVVSLTITRSTNIGTGRGLVVQVCSRCFVSDVQVLEHHNNVHLIASNSCRYHNITVGGGSVLGYYAGNTGVRISSQPLTAGGILRSQIQMFEMFSIGGTPDTFDDAVLIESGDTTFFSDGYISYSRNNNVRVKAADANSPIVSVNLNQVYLDGNVTGSTRVGLRIESDAQAASSPTFITLTGCTIGQLGQGIVSDEPGLGRLIVGGNTEFHNIEHEAIKVSGASAADIQVSGSQFYACGRTSNNAYIDIAGANSVQISSNSANAISFPTNTFVKLAGTIGNVVLGPNVTNAFTTDQDLSAATITELTGVGVHGIFTPTLAFDTPGTSTFAITSGTARWELIGVLFNCHVELVFTPTIGTGTGSLRIGGLPFTSPNVPNNSGGSVGSISGAFTWPAGVTALTVEQLSNSSYARILGNGTGINRVAFGAAHMTTGVPHTLNLQFYTNMKT